MLGHVALRGRDESIYFRSGFGLGLELFRIKLDTVTCAKHLLSTRVS